MTFNLLARIHQLISRITKKKSFQFNLFFNFISGTIFPLSAIQDSYPHVKFILNEKSITKIQVKKEEIEVKWDQTAKKFQIDFGEKLSDGLLEELISLVSLFDSDFNEFIAISTEKLTRFATKNLFKVLGMINRNSLKFLALKAPSYGFGNTLYDELGYLLPFLTNLERFVLFNEETFVGDSAVKDMLDSFYFCSSLKEIELIIWTLGTIKQCAIQEEWIKLAENKAIQDSIFLYDKETRKTILGDKWFVKTYFDINQSN